MRELQCKIGRPHDDVVFLSILRQWLLQIPGEESSREREGIAIAWRGHAESVGGTARVSMWLGQVKSGGLWGKREPDR